MEKENMTQSAAAAQGAQARENTGAAECGLGKFKSVDALLNAYNSLEAEFTRRSQRLRELEGREQALSAEDKQRETVAETAAPAVSAGYSEKEIAEQVRKVAEAYFASRTDAPYIMAEGGGFSAAPAPRVRSLEEAGKLAAELFRKN